MKNLIKKISKIWTVNLIIGILMFTYFMPVVTYAAEIIENSRSTNIKLNASTSYKLTTENMDVYVSGIRFERFIFDGDKNANTYCLRGNSSAYNNQNFVKRTNFSNIGSLTETGDGLGFLGDKTKSINALKWLVDNVYYYTSITTNKEKQIMKENLLEIISRYGGSYSNITTIDDVPEDFIHTAQQFVFWKYMKHNNDKTGYFSGGLSETKLGNFTTSYLSSSKLSDVQKKEIMAIYTALYNASQKVYNGESGVYSINKTQQTLNATCTSTAIQHNSGHFLLGPITINSNAISKISHTVTVDGNKITNYKFTNASGVEKQINSNEAFYIDITSAVGQNPTQIKASYNCNLKCDSTMKLGECYVYTSNSMWSQPILEIRKEIVTKEEKYNFSFTYQMQEIDLALTKQIVKVTRPDGTVKYNSQARFKSVDNTPLTNGKDDATYIMNKTPIMVQPGDSVTYKIKIFNEGSVNAVVKEVTDYLPTGLNATNMSNGKVVIKTNGTTGITINPGSSYENISLTCTVDSDVQLGTTLINVAEISDYGYMDNTTYINSRVSDRDSTQGNIVNNEIQIKEDADLEELDIRKDTTKNNVTEDDDDFEQVQVGKFDLALRKFITCITPQGGQAQQITDREPSFDSQDAVNFGRTENGLENITTMNYLHKKDPIDVKIGTRIKYTIRIYNEGYIDGYAKEVTDYLPKGLSLAPGGNNNSYGWSQTTNSDGTKTVKTSIAQNKLIPASYGAKGINEMLVGSAKYYIDLEIECIVDSDIDENLEPLVNVAEITEYGYRKNPSDANTYVSARTQGIDRDSKANNVFTNTTNIQEKIRSYNQSQNEAKFRLGRTDYKGKQDDDDFEIVVLNPFKIVINKSDNSTGEKLSGAGFTVTRTDNDSGKIVWTDDNGKAELYENVEGEYGEFYEFAITEIKSPDGYTNTLDGIEIVFNVYVTEWGYTGLSTFIIDQEIGQKNYELRYSDTKAVINQNNYTHEINARNQEDYELYNDIHVDIDNSSDIPEVIVDIDNLHEYPYEIKMIKEDKDGNRLTGAVLYDGEYNSLVDSNGETIRGAVIDRKDKVYTTYLTEVSSPTGYENAFKDVYIQLNYKINTSGKLELLSFGDDNPIQSNKYRLVHKNNIEQRIEYYDSEYSLYFNYIEVSVDNTGDVPQIVVLLRNSQYKIEMQMQKLSTSNTPIQGAWLKISDVGHPVQTDVNGYIQKYTRSINSLNNIYTSYFYEYASTDDYDNLFENVAIKVMYKLNSNKQLEIVQQQYGTTSDMKDYSLVYANNLNTKITQSEPEYEYYSRNYIDVNADNTGSVPLLTVKLKNPPSTSDGKYSLKIKKINRSNNSAMGGVKFEVNGTETAATNASTGITNVVSNVNITEENVDSIDRYTISEKLTYTNSDKYIKLNKSISLYVKKHKNDTLNVYEVEGISFDDSSNRTYSNSRAQKTVKLEDEETNVTIEAVLSNGTITVTVPNDVAR